MYHTLTDIIVVECLLRTLKEIKDGRSDGWMIRWMDG